MATGSPPFVMDQSDRRDMNRQFFAGLSPAASGLPLTDSRGLTRQMEKLAILRQLKIAPTLVVLLFLAGLTIGCEGDRGQVDGASHSNIAPSEERTGPARASSIATSLRVGGTSKASESQKTNVRFVDHASELGIGHVYLNGASGSHLMVEATGGGCGWVDYDRDGYCDLYVPQGGNPAERPSSKQPSDRLYRNVGQAGFVDVTEFCGVVEWGYSQGISVGDYDNDGFDDIYVTNVGPNSFFRNQGDGTFQEVAQNLSITGSLWSSSAAWADIDRDGDLDLYVCNYVDFDPLNPRICHNVKGVPAMCHPKLMEAVPDECYLNLGDGTFRPAAKELGLFGPENKALGVAIADFDGDAWPDIFVANDTTPNFLFINHKGNRFEESASLLGCAVSSQGLPQANMGIAVGDYDSNGFLDLCITHFVGEWSTLYQNLGPQGFHDVSARVGLVAATNKKLGFGAVMVDFDQDGHQELFIANGHIDDLTFQGDEFEMTPQLFSFDGRRWFDCGSSASDYFSRNYVGRGVATADFDNDGDLDVAVAHQNAPLAVLRNESIRGSWLRLELIGRSSNRQGIGTRVVVQLPTKDLTQEIIGGTSYCASNQSVMCFGFGDYSGPVSLDILWPSGVKQKLADVEPGAKLIIIEPPATPTEVAEGGGGNR